MKQMSDKEKAYFIALLFPLLWPLALAMFICDLAEAIRNGIVSAYRKLCCATPEDRSDGR